MKSYGSLNKTLESTAYFIKLIDMCLLESSPISWTSESHFPYSVTAEKLFICNTLWFLEKSMPFLLPRSYSDIMGISFVRRKSKFLSLSYKALYQRTFAHSTTFLLPVSLYTLHLGGIYLLSLLEHSLYSGSSHMLSPLFGTSFPQPPCLAISYLSSRSQFRCRFPQESLLNPKPGESSITPRASLLYHYLNTF